MVTSAYSSGIFLQRVSVARLALSFLIALAFKASVGLVMLGGVAGVDGLEIRMVKPDDFMIGSCQMGGLLSFFIVNLCPSSSVLCFRFNFSADFSMSLFRVKF